MHGPNLNGWQLAPYMNLTFGTSTFPDLDRFFQNAEDKNVPRIDGEIALDNNETNTKGRRERVSADMRLRLDGGIGRRAGLKIL